MIKSNTSHIRVRRHYTVMACHVPWELRRAALLHRALGEVASDCWSFSCSKNVFERVEMHFEADMRDVCLTDAPAMKLSVEAPQHGGGAGPWAFELDKNRRLFDPTEARLGLAASPLHYAKTRTETRFWIFCAWKCARQYLILLFFMDTIHIRRIQYTQSTGILLKPRTAEPVVTR